MRLIAVSVEHNHYNRNLVDKNLKEVFLAEVSEQKFHLQEFRVGKKTAFYPTSLMRLHQVMYKLEHKKNITTEWLHIISSIQQL